MPAPATTEEFLDLVQKSGVVDETKLRAYVQKLAESSGIPAQPQKLAAAFVRDAILTHFQAEQLLQGKYKRFSIGKYKVLEKLGAGGMAQVFLCEHKLMRRRVAIKVLPTAKADDPSSLERFYREARAVAAVDHPNIVRAYDIDQDENLHFIVMEFVDGTNLQDLVKKFGPLDVTRACHYIYGAAVGLQHAHEIGLVHRDIKPGNILLDRAGVVKILDMGLARFFHDEEDHLTKKYDEHVLGTADYLAPEQALESHTVDIRADIYALGATFYFLLTGSALFPEGSVAQKLIWHQNRPPRPVKSLRPEVPDAIVAVIDKMLAKDPAKRYQTPAEVMNALADWVATPIPPPSDREMPNLSAAAGGGSRGPSSMAGPPAGTIGPGVFVRTNPAGGSSPATVIASATTTTATPAPAPAPPPAAAPTPAPTPAPAAVAAAAPAEHPAVWASLDTDTQSLAKGDTDRPAPQTEPKSRPRRKGTDGQPAPAGKRTWLYAGVGGLLLAVVGVVIFLTSGKKELPPPPPSSSPDRLLVSKEVGEHKYPTLGKALAVAGPGTTIAIAESPLREYTLTLSRAKYKDVTIESALPDGKPVVIEFAGNGGILLNADSVEGVKIRNIEFDGQGKADPVVNVSGVCPGLTLENVSVRGAKGAGNGIRLYNAAGEAGRPIVLDRVRVIASEPNTSALLLHTIGNLDSKFVTVRNSRFEGVGKGSGVRLDCIGLDLDFTGNRFFNFETAVSFVKVPQGRTLKGQFTGNTVYQMRGTGLTFDATDPKGNTAFAVTQNYFAQVPAVGAVNPPNAPVPGLTFADNAAGPGTGPGNLNPAVQLAPVPNPQVQSTNPADDDAKFLRFPGTQPEVGGKKVGAP